MNARYIPPHFCNSGMPSVLYGYVSTATATAVDTAIVATATVVDTAVAATATNTTVVVPSTRALLSLLYQLMRYQTHYCHLQQY
jgi:hypothetical protein